MGLHGRRSGKLVFDSFRSCSWTIMPKPQIFLPNKSFSQFEPLVPAWSRAKFRIEISSRSLVSPRLGLQGRANKNLCNPFSNEARRFYYVDQSNNVRQHRKSRGFSRWFLVGVLTVTCCSGVIVKTYYDHLEIVPYHERTRLILFSKSKLRSFLERQFKEKKESFAAIILPDTHLESIRVRRIAQDIINVCEDEIRRQDSQLSALNLDGLDWEVLVVSGFGNACSLECGKIVLFDWIFEHITSDAEIAFLIGREIGHIVARHYAENVTTKYCFKILRSMLNPIGLWDEFKVEYAASFLRIVWKQEFEADYIGISLCASAGYDPREASKLLEKIDKFATRNIGQPTPKMRAEYLSSPHIMKEPLHIYIRECIKSK